MSNVLRVAALRALHLPVSAAPAAAPDLGSPGGIHLTHKEAIQRASAEEVAHLTKN